MITRDNVTRAVKDGIIQRRYEVEFPEFVKVKVLDNDYPEETGDFFQWGRDILGFHAKLVCVIGETFDNPTEAIYEIL